MIPPELRERLIRGLTQKLVDSPVFNSLVRTTQGTIDAFIQGIEEGKGQSAPASTCSTPDAQAEATQRKQQQYEQAKQQTQQQQQQTRYNPPKDFEKPYQPKASPKPENTTTSSDTTGKNTNTNPADKQLSDLESFLARMRNDLKEAERRADAQKKR